MARTSSTSNPTGLVEIDRQRVTIEVTRDSEARYAALTKLDLAGYQLPLDLQLILIARAGATFCRIPLGTLGSWNRSPCRLDDLDPRGFLRFRVLIHAANDPQLIASAENLLARDLEQADSLLSMEPADLGEVIWRISWNQDEPVLQFNHELFPNAKAATGYPPFCAFVLPEVVRQVAQKIADEPEKFSDETDALYQWKPLLETLGVEEPPDTDDGSDSVQWVDGVVEAFAKRGRFVSEMKRMLYHVD